MNMIDSSQRMAAKVVGFLYLFTNATAIFAFSIRGKLIASGEAARTATNIAGSERLFRIGIANELITIVGVFALIWGLYVILNPIDRNLVWLATFLRLAENFVLAFVTVLELAVLALVKSSAYLQSFATEQSQGLAYMFLRIYGEAFSIGFLFLGLGSAVFSYLWWKSRYIPRLLAGWGIFASLVMALMSLAIIVFPTLSKLGLTYMMPMGLYEFGLGLWLLIKGIQAPPPPEVAPSAADSPVIERRSIPR
jgi:Domain of unknown function (DUF4386)